MKKDKGSKVKHLAVIMDGNGRWAKKKGLNRVKGHEKGAQVAIDIVQDCLDLGIAELTLFALSTENMTRPLQEVCYIKDLFVNVLQEKKQLLHENGVCVKIVGNINPLGEKVCSTAKSIESLTEKNNTLRLNIAFNYSGRWQIKNAISKILQEYESSNKKNNWNEYFEEIMKQGMKYDPDLMIRTGGENRISNFMLWQIAYTELYFTSCQWPDFNKEHLIEALDYFSSTSRRFGQIEKKSIHNN